IILGPGWSIQAPPNLSYDEFPRLLDAGIDDWGGVSPVTMDHVNPEAPWPEVDRLRVATESRGLELASRLPLYPAYVRDLARWVDPTVAPHVLRRTDAEGFAREDRWFAGASTLSPPTFASEIVPPASIRLAGEGGLSPTTLAGESAPSPTTLAGESAPSPMRWASEGRPQPKTFGPTSASSPATFIAASSSRGAIPARAADPPPVTPPPRVGSRGSIHPPPNASVPKKPSHNRAGSVPTLPPPLATALAKSAEGVDLDEDDVVAILGARGRDARVVAAAADRLRQEVSGDDVTYVVTRNINYTNVCYFRCGFCAFSKGKLAANLRGRPYLVPLDEIVRRSREAWDRGAVEVCLQGGIHPGFTGDFYLDVCQAIREAVPGLHVHAFSALEVWQGAATLGKPLDRYLERLKAAGLASLPGTAAEILDDEVRE